MGPYSANVLGPISLFNELIRLKQGDVAKYVRTREAAWQWLERYPLQNNVWVGYFEDVAPSMGNMNNAIPLETARYVLLHPEKDKNWQQHARGTRPAEDRMASPLVEQSSLTSQQEANYGSTTYPICPEIRQAPFESGHFRNPNPHNLRFVRVLAAIS